MNDDEGDDCGHADEVDQPRTLKAVEQRRQLGELYRLPHRPAGQHLHDDHQDDAGIEQSLHGIVPRYVLMREAEAQRLADLGKDFARANRKELAAEAAREESISNVDQPVHHQDPHGEEMPLQRTLRLASDRDPLRKMQPAEQHFVIVDLPSAADHEDHRKRVDPVHDAHRQGMQPPAAFG